MRGIIEARLRALEARQDREFESYREGERRMMATYDAMRANHDKLLEALEALTEWARDNTSPADPNSPHALLIAAQEAIAQARGNQR